MLLNKRLFESALTGNVESFRLAVEESDLRVFRRQRL